jgi:hypothetical protein
MMACLLRSAVIPDPAITTTATKRANMFRKAHRCVRRVEV